MVKKCMLILHFFCLCLPLGKMVDQIGLTSLNFGVYFDLFYDFHVRFDDILEL
jgi:hypothetical protein